MKLWSVGHSNRTLDDLIALLRSYGIVTLCDVRAFPASKRHPQFDGAALHAAWGDGYGWLGKELGGFRKEGYERHMQSDLFRAGIEQLLAHARKAPTVYLCAERDWRGCHRRFISDHLVSAAGVDVWHILDTDTKQRHPPPQLELF